MFREFFSYLQKNEPGIVKDEQAQQRWLTQQLRKALKEKLATFTSPQDDPDYPSNRTFIGSWDSPINLFHRRVETLRKTSHHRCALQVGTEDKLSRR